MALSQELTALRLLLKSSKEQLLPVICVSSANRNFAFYTGFRRSISINGIKQKPSNGSTVVRHIQFSASLIDNFVLVPFVFDVFDSG